jgi:hypothetical protein
MSAIYGSYSWLLFFIVRNSTHTELKPEGQGRYKKDYRVRSLLHTALRGQTRAGVVTTSPHRDTTASGHYDRHSAARGRGNSGGGGGHFQPNFISGN